MTLNISLIKYLESVQIFGTLFPFFDNNPDYFKSLEKLIGIHIHTPFIGIEKHRVIAKFSKNIPLVGVFPV